MSVKTFEEYLKSLRKLKPTVYMFGERLENPVDNPRIRAGINATGATYELANNEKYRDLITRSLLSQENGSIGLPCHRNPSKILSCE